MEKKIFKFSNSSTEFFPTFKFSGLGKLSSPATTILITDENIFKAHATKFKNWNTIVLKAGEDYKIQGTVDSVVEQLIAFEADRGSTLVGVGGGCISDITGYAASVYMRGIRFGFIPTSILGLVDASIGGKNGIDVGPYKNMVGLVRQPAFILHDLDFLSTLPKKEWVNGFAEIIKHAAILDASMFRVLENGSLDFFRKTNPALTKLIQRNFLIKMKLVQRDEFEKGDRRLLNFGHTLGHALETRYELMHGEAISIGMAAACRLSEKLTGFNQSDRLFSLLEKYKLPTNASFDPVKIYNVIKMDKKRERNQLHYVLLEKIGKAVVEPVSLKQVEKFIHSLS